MALFVAWITGHWLPALQATGIVGSLLFTGFSLRLNTRVQRVQTLINLTQQHRTLWLKTLDSPKLQKILSEDPSKEPFTITLDEKIFVNLVLLHLTSTLFAVRKGVVDKPAGLDTDIREFLSLPIPRSIWEEYKPLRDKGTIRYVDSIFACRKDNQGT